MTKIAVIVADDQPLIRDGLAAILGMEERFEVVARTGDGLETVRQAQLHRPHLVLMDIHMPKLDGLQAAKQIKAELLGTKIVILTTFEDEDYILEGMRCGASGFLVKGAETTQILSVIDDCLDGRMNYPFSIQMRLIQALQGDDRREEPATENIGAPPVSDDRLANLTLQERNIARSLKQGKSNQAIAADLFLTTGTVKNYLNAVYKKLNVSSRSEAIALLHELRL